jgi:hypothetical protein
MRKVNLAMLFALGLLMTPLNLSDHVSAESSSIQHISRPSNNAIEIRDVRLKTIDKGKRSERYEVQMTIHNIDENWSAAEVCIHVRFRDPGKKVVDAHQTACLQNLKPLEQRQFIVSYAGSFPRYASKVIPEPQVASVKWAPND